MLWQAVRPAGLFRQGQRFLAIRCQIGICSPLSDKPIACRSLPCQLPVKRFAARIVRAWDKYQVELLPWADRLRIELQPVACCDRQAISRHEAPFKLRSASSQLPPQVRIGYLKDVSEARQIRNVAIGIGEDGGTAHGCKRHRICQFGQCTANLTAGKLLMSAGHLVCVTSGLGIQKLNCAKQALIWIPSAIAVPAFPCRAQPWRRCAPNLAIAHAVLVGVPRGAPGVSNRWCWSNPTRRSITTIGPTTRRLFVRSLKPRDGGTDYPFT